MLKAIHLKAAGLTNDWATALVEMTLSGMAGVARVVTVKSIGVISVMFDDSMTNAEKIVHAVQATGFDVRVLRAGG